MSYADFYRRSIEQPEEFWGGEASRIHWEKPYTRVLDDSRAPLNRWFIDGQTNLCYNAVDRWAQSQPEQAALIAVSTEVGADGEPVEKMYSFRELQAEVERMSAIMLALGVGRGDRVLIYMPMIAEAVFAMLACARIGAVHSVVFGGFASNSLATRIDDAQPKLVVSADAG
jgi:propionyl-CoA synthetase